MPNKELIKQQGRIFRWCFLPLPKDPQAPLSKEPCDGCSGEGVVYNLAGEMEFCNKCYGHGVKGVI